MLLLLLPCSTWLPAWLYSSYRFLPAGLMVSLLFLLSVLLRNLYARNFIFSFSPNLYFFSLGSRNSFYLFPDTRNFSCWFTQPIAPVFGSLTHKISRILVTHYSRAQRKVGRQHTRDHYDIEVWFSPLVGTWLFNWESVGLGLSLWLDQFFSAAVVHCEADLPAVESILQPIFF